MIKTSTEKDFYVQEDKMYVATDCIIFGFDSEKLKLLIFKRRVKPNNRSLVLDRELC